MSVYIDRKYLLIVSNRLNRFSQKTEDLYNFRCPYCGDSKKNTTKSRGYVYRKSNDYFFRCHNCNYSTTFSKFLQFIDESIYKQYALERYTDGANGNCNFKKPEFKSIKSGIFEKFKEKLNVVNIKNLPLPRASELDSDCPAMHYLTKRKIPKTSYDEIFYAEDFKKFMDSTFQNHEKDLDQNDRRIVLCFTNRCGNVTNISGRTLGDSKKRYVTVKVMEERKVFGLHKVNFNKTVYVTEGQFDSMFIDNCIASGDSNLIGLVKDLGIKDCVLVFDNEPRGKEINNEISKAIDLGHSICLFPNFIQGKDINEMILYGHEANELQEIIKQNTFSGLSAKLAHTAWKKV
jgi:DNA primase